MQVFFLSGIWEQLSWGVLTSGSGSQMSSGAAISEGLTGAGGSTFRLAPSHPWMASSSWQLEGGLCFSTQSSSVSAVCLHGRALGFLQEQMAQRESKRKPQCLGASHGGRRPFLPYSVCQSESLCSVYTIGKGIRLHPSEGGASKNLKPPQSTSLHLLCSCSGADSQHFLGR